MEKIMNIRDAIKTAIQMEKDGYSFYIKAAAQTTNKMGKEIFESLASDEQVHLDVFKKLFDDTIGNKEWENLVFSSKKYADIPIFPKDLKSIEGASPNTNDLDALRIAMDAEKEAIDYYSEMLICEKNEDTKRILNEIIEQEKHHYFILEQELDFLNQTGEWYKLQDLGRSL